MGLFVLDPKVVIAVGLKIDKCRGWMSFADAAETFARIEGILTPASGASTTLRTKGITPTGFLYSPTDYGETAAAAAMITAATSSGRDKCGAWLVGRVTVVA